jgi:hypothetical protein
MVWKLLMIVGTTLLLLTACNGNGSNSDTPQPLVIQATSGALDAGFVTYRHDTDVFSIRIPQGWVSNNLPDDNGVRVEFSTLEGDKSVVRLTIYVVNTGAPLTQETFLQTANAYQLPDDIASFQWEQLEGPVDQADGSRRITGVRYYPTVGARALNIFMQRNGQYFSVAEVDVTDIDPAQLSTLRTIINTFRVNADVEIEEGDVTVGITSYTGNIGFGGYRHWEDDGGGFNITGYVINNQNVPIEAIRLTGYLYDARGNQLTERSDILSQDVLQPNESASFRLRFEGGRPSTAVRYELHAAARTAEFSLNSFYGNENFEVIREEGFNESGNFFVRGQLINIGSRLVQDVKINVTVFDAEGNVVGSETLFITKDQLLPNEADAFELVIYDLGAGAVRYDLQVMGQAE